MAPSKKKPKKPKPRQAILPEVAYRDSTIAHEALPYPIVHYPGHYGTFFGFAPAEGEPVVLCQCTESAVGHYVRLRRMQQRGSYDDPLKGADVDSNAFAWTVASLVYPEGRPQFVPKLCHRCNLITPALRYCHEMYGTQFIQYHGWYVNLALFRLGIDPPIFAPMRFLADVCPPEYQEQIQAINTTVAALDSIEQHALLAKLSRPLTREIENGVREEFGYKKVGERWTSETMLYQTVARIYPDQEILRHHRPTWLEGLELDIYLPALRLAFEYQGQQHFHPIKAWGGEKALAAVQARDVRKAALCIQLQIRLVCVDYTEPLHEAHIRSRLDDSAPM